jgi:hypothetical protein
MGRGGGARVSIRRVGKGAWPPEPRAPGVRQEACQESATLGRSCEWVVDPRPGRANSFSVATIHELGVRIPAALRRSTSWACESLQRCDEPRVGRANSCNVATIHELGVRIPATLRRSTSWACDSVQRCDDPRVGRAIYESVSTIHELGVRIPAALRRSTSWACEL